MAIFADMLLLSYIPERLIQLNLDYFRKERSSIGLIIKAEINVLRYFIACYNYNRKFCNTYCLLKILSKIIKTMNSAVLHCN